jgi:hypothetical protein
MGKKFNKKQDISDDDSFGEGFATLENEFVEEEEVKSEE